MKSSYFATLSNPATLSPSTHTAPRTRTSTIPHLAPRTRTPLVTHTASRTRTPELSLKPPSPSELQLAIRPAPSELYLITNYRPSHQNSHYSLTIHRLISRTKIKKTATPGLKPLEQLFLCTSQTQQKRYNHISNPPMASHIRMQAIRSEVGERQLV
jgi:hypothetical protein